MSARIQRRRSAGWTMPPGAVYIGRPSRWGNPFRVGHLVRDPGYSSGPAHPYDGVLPAGRYYGFEIRAVRDRADAVALFRDYARGHDDEWNPGELRYHLGGRDLACWCPLPEPGQPDLCHGAVLLNLIDQIGGTP